MTAGTLEPISRGVFIASAMGARLGKHLGRIALFMQKYPTGLILLSGPMRAGKSAILLTLLELLKENSSVLCVKPKRDTRSKRLTSRNGNSARAQTVKSAHSFRALVRARRPSIIVFDEAQFTDLAMCDEILRASTGALVIVATLDTDFTGTPWPVYTALASARRTHPNTRLLSVRLTGICQECGNQRATHSKLVATPPEDSRVLVGDAEYRTVCAACHGAPVR